MIKTEKTFCKNNVFLGSPPDGRDAFRTLNAASTSKSSCSIYSSSEAETTTTDDDETDTDSSEFNGPAEIRSPIQTKLKFKKYGLDDFNFIKVLGKGSFGKVSSLAASSFDNCIINLLASFCFLLLHMPTIFGLPICNSETFILIRIINSLQ